MLATLLILVFWYPLKKGKVQENERILAERRAAAGPVSAEGPHADGKTEG
ncbi:hypothetical protein [Nigerium massiliense]|nr:hypothetical protein [Nigerium massiliense]